MYNKKLNIMYKNVRTVDATTYQSAMETRDHLNGDSINHLKHWK